MQDHGVAGTHRHFRIASFGWRFDHSFRDSCHCVFLHECRWVLAHCSDKTTRVHARAQEIELSHEEEDDRKMYDRKTRQNVLDSIFLSLSIEFPSHERSVKELAQERPGRLGRP